MSLREDEACTAGEEDGVLECCGHGFPRDENPLERVVICTIFDKVLNNNEGFDEIRSVFRWGLSAVCERSGSCGL